MKIAIRLDDITEDMDWEKFLRFKELLDVYRIKPLIGVIPCSKDPKLEGFRKSVPVDYASISEGKADDFWGYVDYLSKSGWCIAMHGTNHVYTTKNGGLMPLNSQSEYAGLPYEEQFRLLEEGDRQIKSHGINTDMFMAPAHSFDKNTLSALSKLGYTKITDGFGSYPYERYGMVFYPISFNRKSVLKSNKGGYTTFVYHTNTMSNKDFEAFEKLLKGLNRDEVSNDKELSAVFIDYSEYLKIAPVRRDALTDLYYRLMARSKQTLVNIRKKL